MCALLITILITKIVSIKTEIYFNLYEKQMKIFTLRFFSSLTNARVLNLNTKIYINFDQILNRSKP